MDAKTASERLAENVFAGVVGGWEEIDDIVRLEDTTLDDAVGVTYREIKANIVRQINQTFEIWHSASIRTLHDASLPYLLTRSLPHVERLE